MENSIEKRIAKLPAWVRMHIQALESRLREQAEAISVLSHEDSEQSTGKVTVNIGISNRGVREEIALPDHSVISFNFGRHTKISMNAALDDPLVQVYSHPGLLYVMPRSANAVHLINENAFERRKFGD